MGHALTALLLDTHALIWWVAVTERLSATAIEAIATASRPVFVSAVSAFELTTKYRLGRLPDAGRLADSFDSEVATEGFRELPISVEHAAKAGRFPQAHSDPFDRLLAAQALQEGLTLVSCDPQLDQFGVTRLW